MISLVLKPLAKILTVNVINTLIYFVFGKIREAFAGQKYLTFLTKRTVFSYVLVVDLTS